MRALVRYCLENALSLPRTAWQVQGFGFLRLRVDNGTRLHIWDSRLRVPEVSDIHDHSQWAFVSHVISGCIVNLRYTLVENGLPFKMATLVCGVGGGMKSESPEEVFIRPGVPELYLPGEHYRQEPDEIHRTMAMDGTVTVLEQERRDVDTARVLWPLGSKWGSAVPRQATEMEIQKVTAFALSFF